jgi:GDP-L-fucose synthase
MYVINAAGFVGGIEINKNRPGDFLRKNLLIQQNIFNSSIKNNAKKVIFFGSSCMYPNNLKRAINEDDLLQGNIEKTSIGYALSKITGIYSCLLFNEQYKKNIFIPLIPNSIYGPNDNFDIGSSHVLSALISKFHSAKIKNEQSVTLWGSGTPRREFIYVDDLAEICLLILTGKVNINSLPINIGTGEDISIKELSLIVSRVVGYSGNILWDKSKPNGTMRKLLDSSKLHSYWKPKTSLISGIEKTYDWYKKFIDI